MGDGPDGCALPLQMITKYPFFLFLLCCLSGNFFFPSSNRARASHFLVSAQFRLVWSQSLDILGTGFSVLGRGQPKLPSGMYRTICAPLTHIHEIVQSDVMSYFRLLGEPLGYNKIKNCCKYELRVLCNLFRNFVNAYQGEHTKSSWNLIYSVSTL